MLSGTLTDEDEQAVEEELAEILSKQMPEVPETKLETEEVEEGEKEKESPKKGSLFHNFLRK